MPRVYILSLQPEHRSALEAVVSRGENWRSRERAQTLLLLDEGVSAFDTATKLGINFRTVYTTRRNWFRDGLASLPDLPRSGAPKKITPEQLAKIVAMAIAAPLTAKQLLARHVQSGGSLVNVGTLTTALKSTGLVWKRTRHSLKKT